MRHYVTFPQRALDEAAWAALVHGATDLGDDSIPDEPVCEVCGGTGIIETANVYGDIWAGREPGGECR